MSQHFLLSSRAKTLRLTDVLRMTDGDRHGLFVDARLTKVSGRAERLAALDMIEPRADKPEAITLGGDKGFDAADFVMELREINVTPHVAQNTARRSAIDGRTTRHPGYAPRAIFFSWTGFDEGDEISGTGSADLKDNGTVEIELNFHNSDAAVLKACRS